MRTGKKLLAYTANQIFARGLHALLGSDLEVVTISPVVCALGAAVEAVRPSIVLLDELRADLGSVAAVNRQFPEVKIIAWINSDSPELCMQLVEAGAVALLQNNCAEQELVECIAAVRKGLQFIPAGLKPAMWTARRCEITPREGELMHRVSQGLTNKEIAWQLKITEGTVKVYLSRLFSKLGVSDRYELALLGLRNGTAENSSASRRRQMEDPPGLRVPMPAAVYLASN